MVEKAHFLPDIFSNNQPVFSEIDVSEFNEIKGLFETLYKHLEAEVISVKRCGGFEINSNNFLIVTNNGSYILKRISELDDTGLGALEKQSALMAWLFEEKALCPYPIKAMDQAYIFSIEDNKWVSLMSFIPGIYFPGKEKCNMRDIGGAVGKFHFQLKSAPDILKPDRTYPQLSRTDEEMFEAVSSDLDNNLQFFPKKHQKILIENISFLNKIWDKVLSNKKVILDGEFGLAHIDLHPHNLIMRNNKLASFLDFDSLMYAPLKIMVGFSCYKLLRQVVCKEEGRLSNQEIGSLVDSYLEGIFRFMPDSYADRKIIALSAYTEICRRIAYILRLNIQEDNSKWNHVLMIQVYGLKEVELLFKL